jgi:hypothetical protein
MDLPRVLHDEPVSVFEVVFPTLPHLPLAEQQTWMDQLLDRISDQNQGGRWIVVKEGIYWD